MEHTDTKEISKVISSAVAVLTLSTLYFDKLYPPQPEKFGGDISTAQRL